MPTDTNDTIEVDVPDLGIVEFPSSMSEDDITKVIRGRLQPSTPSIMPEPYTPKVPPSPELNPRGTAPVSSPATSFASGANVGAGGVLKGLAGILTAIPKALQPEPGYKFTSQRQAAGESAKTMQDIQASPLYKAGQYISETGQQIKPKEDTAINRVASAAGGFLPLVASGPAAPATIGLQALGDTLSSQYDAFKAQGLSDEDAASKAMGQAVANGAGQALLWEALPGPLKKVIGKATGLVGDGAVKQFLARRAVGAAEGAVLGGASQAAQNVTTGQSPLANVPAAAGGMAILGAVTPQGETGLKPPPLSPEVQAVAPLLPRTFAEAAKVPSPLPEQGPLQPPPIKPEEPNASSQQETAKVHGHLQPQPIEGQGQVPAEEGGGGIQPQVQGQNQVALRPPPNIDRLYQSEHADLIEQQKAVEQARANGDAEAERKARVERDDTIQRLQQFDKLYKRQPDVAWEDSPETATAKALRDNPKLSLDEAMLEGQRLRRQDIDDRIYDEEPIPEAAKKEYGVGEKPSQAQLAVTPTTLEGFNPPKAPEKFNTLQDLLDYRSKYRQAEIDFYKSLGLNDAEALKFFRAGDNRSNLDVSALEDKLTPENKERLERFSKGEGGEVYTWDKMFDPNLIVGETDKGALSQSLVGSMGREGLTPGMDDHFIYTVAALRQLKDNGGTWSDVARALDGYTTRNASSQGDKAFLFKKMGADIRKFAESQDIDLPQGDLQRAVGTPAAEPKAINQGGAPQDLSPELKKQSDANNSRAAFEALAKAKGGTPLPTPPIVDQTVNKEPWQMTKAEWSKTIRAEYGMQGWPDLAAKQQADATHRTEVESALKSGKPVPPKVLVDYPDLKPSVKTEAPAVEKPKAPSLTPEERAIAERSTPRKGTPERDKYDNEVGSAIMASGEAYKKSDAAVEAYKAAKFGSPKYAKASIAADKAADEYRRLKPAADEARKKYQTAGLEDLAEEGIPIASDYAKRMAEAARQLKSREENPSARKSNEERAREKQTLAYEIAREELQKAYRDRGLTEKEAIEEAANHLSSLTSYPLAEGPRLEDRLNRMAEVVKDRRAKADLLKQFDAIESQVKGTAHDRFRARIESSYGTIEESKKALEEYKDWVKENNERLQKENAAKQSKLDERTAQNTAELKPQPVTKFSMTDYGKEKLSEGKFISDGKVMLDTSALKPSEVKKFRARPKLMETQGTGITQANAEEKIWKPFVKDAKTPLTLIGYRKTTSGDELAYYADPKTGKFWAIDSAYDRLIDRASAGGEKRVLADPNSKRNDPVVIYHGDKPVAVVMPFAHGENVDVDVKSALQKAGQNQVFPPGPGAATRPPQTGEGYELPADPGNSDIYGVSAEVREQRAKAGQVDLIPPGEGISAQESVQRGQELIELGVDPEKRMSDFEQTKKLSSEDMAVVRAQGEKLALDARRIEEKFGTDSDEYRAAKQALSDWDRRSKVMQTEWHKTGQAQQGETDIDTGSFTGLARAYTQGTDKEFTPKQAEQAKQVAKRSADAQAAADKAADALNQFLKNPGTIPDDVLQKAIWTKVKAYIDKGMDNYNDVISKISTELGLTTAKVQELIAKNKTAKRLANDAWAKQQKARDFKEGAKRWVMNQAVPGWWRALQSIPRRFFAAKVGFHGTVPLGTHAPLVAFQPRYWEAYAKAYGSMYKLVGSPAYYEMQRQALVRKPNWTEARRAGLQNDPDTPEDYTSPQTAQYFGKLAGMGNRGYFVLKTLRQDMFDQHWNKLPDTLKTPELRKAMAAAIADGINHATGVVKWKAPKLANNIFFAPRLDVSRAAWLVGDPFRALKTVGGWAKATPEEKYFAVNQFKEKAWVAGTAFSLLALNQGILNAVGSNQKINGIPKAMGGAGVDPMRSDFLKFKVAGMDVSYGNPFVTAARLPIRVAILRHQGGSGKLAKLIYPDESIPTELSKYLRTQLHPMTGDIADVLFKGDYENRPLPKMPLSGAPLGMPKRLAARGEKPYTWPELGLEVALPIPAEEAVKDAWKHGFGTDPEHVKVYLDAIAKAAFMGATGARLTDDTQTPKN